MCAKACLWMCVWVHLLSLLVYICCLRILFLPLFRVTHESVM